MEVVDGSSPQKKKQRLMSLGQKDSKDQKDNDQGKDKPLIAQSILLRILAEIVSSYPQCAACITQEPILSGMLLYEKSYNWQVLNITSIYLIR